MHQEFSDVHNRLNLRHYLKHSVSVILISRTFKYHTCLIVRTKHESDRPRREHSRRCSIPIIEKSLFQALPRPVCTAASSTPAFSGARLVLCCWQQLLPSSGTPF